MDYIKVAVRADSATSDILAALLSERGYDTFEETADGLAAYIPASKYTRLERQHIEALCRRYRVFHATEHIPARNWNEEWESNFQPIKIGLFCGVRASFHSPMAGVAHELVIDPRMAFGTGHHETTAMMMAAMEGIPFEGASVLDFGCGTGILSILATKLGATRVVAVDVESESCKNARENAAANGVAGITVIEGSLDKVETWQHDVVLANINRNVILSSLGELNRRLLRTPGNMLLSGFVREDEPVMLEALAAAGLEASTVSRKNNWLAIRASKMGH